MPMKSNIHRACILVIITLVLLVPTNQISAEKSLSSISLSASLLNETIVLEGRIDPHHLARVTVELTKPDNETVILHTMSDLYGYYKVLYSPASHGQYTAISSWEGDEDHLGAKSVAAKFIVGIFGLEESKEFQEKYQDTESFSISVTQIASNVIGLSQAIEFDWRIFGINSFGEKGHTNIHCMDDRHIERPKEEEWMIHYRSDIISEPIKNYEPDGFHDFIMPKSAGIFYCRVHATDGTRNVLSSVYAIEVLDLKQLLEPKPKGRLSFDKVSYEITDRPIIRYDASSLNKNHDTIDIVTAKFWTDSDIGGVGLTLRETSYDSGIFEEIVSFCFDGGCGSRLRAQEGDLVTVYVPSTGAVAHAVIQGKTVPLAQRVSVAEMGIVDEEGKMVDKIIANEEFFIRAKLINNLNRYQEMRFIVQVKDTKDATVLLASQKVTLPPLSSLTINQLWMPMESSPYTVEVMIWQNFGHPIPLAQQKVLQIPM